MEGVGAALATLAPLFTISGGSNASISSVCSTAENHYVIQASVTESTIFSTTVRRTLLQENTSKW